MKLRFKLISFLLVLSILYLPSYSNAATINNTEVDLEQLVPDFSLPSLSQLMRMRVNNSFNNVKIETTWQNVVSDKTIQSQYLNIQLYDIQYQKTVTFMLVNRSNFTVIKEMTLVPGQGFNVKLDKGIQWDLYVKGTGSYAFGYATYKVFY